MLFQPIGRERVRRADSPCPVRFGLVTIREPPAIDKASDVIGIASERQLLCVFELSDVIHTVALGVRRGRVAVASVIQNGVNFVTHSVLLANTNAGVGAAHANTRTTAITTTLMGASIAKNQAMHYGHRVTNGMNRSRHQYITNLNVVGKSAVFQQPTMVASEMNNALAATVFANKCQFVESLFAMLIELGGTPLAVSGANGKQFANHFADFHHALFKCHNLGIVASAVRENFHRAGCLGFIAVLQVAARHQNGGLAQVMNHVLVFAIGKQGTTRFERGGATGNALGNVSPGFGADMTDHIEDNLDDQIIAIRHIVAVDHETIGLAPGSDFVIQSHVITARQFDDLLVERHRFGNLAVNCSFRHSLSDALGELSCFCHV